MLGTSEATKTGAKQPANDTVTKTGANQPAYDPVTVPSLASLPGNILSLFSSVFDVGLVLGGLVFGVTNNFSCLFYFASFESFRLLPKR